MGGGQTGNTIYLLSLTQYHPIQLPPLERGLTMKKHSVKIGRHATSISLEEPFWIALKELADEQAKALNQLIAEIDEARSDENLSSALRVYVLEALKWKISGPAARP
jgi:predicted DNA-binding ribbon-helix-helix protein